MSANAVSVALERSESASRSRGFLECVWDSVERDPLAVAVVDGGGELSYGELWSDVEELAARLRRAGVGRESLVGLAVSRSRALVVGVLAVIRTGGAFVPLS